MPTKTKNSAKTAKTNGRKKAAATGLPSEQLTDKQLLEMFEILLTCRLTDERARFLFRQGKFRGNHYSAVGQEATHVGTLYGCRESDWIGPAHRDMVASVVKGVPLKRIFAQLFACVDSYDRGKTTPAHMGSPEHNIIIPSSTIAAQLQLVTGVAYGLKRQGKDDIGFAFCGDGATSTGAFHEALNFAGVHRLGMVYVVQNNLWAESVPIRLQTASEKLSDKALGYGFPGVTLDGTDILAVYDAAQQAIARARAGEGPTLIECLCYRWYGHSEIDPAKYRPQEEVEAWRKKDPVKLFEGKLRDRGLLDDKKRQAIEERVTKNIDAAVKFAEQSPKPDASEATLHVYAEIENW